MIERGCPFRDELLPMTALDLFRLMASKKASDLFVTVGIPPSLKVDGQILPVKTDSLSAQATHELALSIMDESQRQSFGGEKDTNFGKMKFPIRRNSI